ncbi:hypothetical protein ACFE04_030643 [Oxalis oulophora]
MPSMQKLSVVQGIFYFVEKMKKDRLGEFIAIYREIENHSRLYSTKVPINPFSDYPISKLVKVKVKEDLFDVLVLEDQRENFNYQIDEEKLLGQFKLDTLRVPIKSSSLEVSMKEGEKFASIE